MDWSSEFDRAHLGEDAQGALDAADMAFMLGTWRAGHVMRYRTKAGEAAWLRLTKAGALHCCAIAPWASLFDDDWIRERDMFSGEPWPKTWRTKRNSGIAPDVSNDWSMFSLGGYACGMLAAKRAILCKVVELGEDGALSRVQTTPDGPELDVSDMPHVSRWFGLTKWPEGCAALWEAGVWQFGNYPLLTIRAGVAQAKHEGRGVRRGKVEKPAQEAKSAAPVVAPKPVVQELASGPEFELDRDGKARRIR